MKKQKALVVGATGLLGREAVKVLLARGFEVRGLVRQSSEKKGVELSDLGSGVELMRGDLKHSECLPNACSGVDVVVSTATATMSRQPGDSIETVDLAGNLNLLRAAEDADVKRFVFVSFNEVAETFPLQTAKRTVETALAQSRINEVVVRAPLFMEVWLSQALGFEAAARRARIYGSGENPVSWVSIVDVAAFIGAAAAGEVSGVVDVPGSEMLTPLEIVKMFEELSGDAFVVDKVPVEVLRARFDEATDLLEKSFLALTLDFARGHQEVRSDRIARGPVRMMSIRRFVQDSLRNVS